MKIITFISTMHQENGNCNADKLCMILNKFNPQVVFLEALENTYTDYDKLRYSSFGILHNNLEIAAIQKYSINKSFDYVPVLEKELSELFDKKYRNVSQNNQLQRLIDDYNEQASILGFQFLNSEKSMSLHREMRTLESQILNNPKLNYEVREHIDEYEKSMIQNIYAYSKRNNFENAVFMCGSAHRQSLIEKMSKHSDQEHKILNWEIYGD